ncbi:GGDEF domain-containing protein [Neiella marina]|uniref:diguanylate cyclase n=1 Tax=Neiella marina TaxID=508461 RepID=A0A8J2XNP3_9GAMM|nr:GGDEF domain-containing protein [Neiella marina]GGA70252.1 GGDEF domain-containing protein [Neiella marina]
MLQLYPFLWPLIVVISLIWASQLPSLWSSEYLSVYQAVPYGLGALLVALSIPFRQGRVAILAVMYMAIFAIIQIWLQQPMEIAFSQKVFVIIAVAVPLNLAVMSFCSEQPLLSPLGMMSLAVALSQFLIAYLLVQHEASFDSWLESWLAVRPVSWLWQPISCLLMALACLMTLAWRYYKYRQTFDLDLAVTIVIATWMLAMFEQAYVSATGVIAMQLILCRSFLSSSYRMAFYDELTQLPGRRALVSDLKHASRSYCMAMTDVDHFKKFNDTYGHDTGDDVLKLVAAKLANVTGGGRAYRFGGEEFAVVFRNAEPAACVPHLEALREAIGCYDLIVRDASARPDSNKLGRQQRGQKPKKLKTTHVTISLGLAQRQTGEDYEAVMKRADQALYKAKENGRNRLELAD